MKGILDKASGHGFFSPMTSDQPSFQDYLLDAKRACALGREVLLDYFGRLSRVDEKKLAGLVTEADLESERVISEFLLSRHPNISILGEEGYSQNDGHDQSEILKRPYWVLDPLDGTTNYVHQFPIFCISLALMIEGEVVVGVVDAPKLNQSFYAFKGSGAFLNDKKINVSSRTNLKDSLLATGFYSHDQKILSEQVRLFSNVIQHTRGVRRPGAAAYDLCMVASGVFDGFWEKNLNPWDTAAGSLLVTESDGRVTDFKGSDFSPIGPEILATNDHLHSSIIEKLITT